MNAITLPSFNALLKATTVWKYQRRSKRVITLWVKRERPAYYDIPHGIESVLFIDKDHPFRQAWEQERQAWFDYVAEYPYLTCIACYPATHWIHITLELDHMIQVDFNKETDCEEVIVDHQFNVR